VLDIRILILVVISITDGQLQTMFLCSLGQPSAGNLASNRLSLSTTEAEYIAAAEACKELIWINRLYQDLAIPTLLNEISSPIVYIDNQPSGSPRTGQKSHMIVQSRTIVPNTTLGAGVGPVRLSMQPW